MSLTGHYNCKNGPNGNTRYGWILFRTFYYKMITNILHKLHPIPTDNTSHSPYINTYLTSWQKVSSAELEADSSRF